MSIRKLGLKRNSYKSEERQINRESHSLLTLDGVPRRLNGSKLGLKKRLLINQKCDGFNHDWKEEYYGYRCARCDMFYAFGQASWEYDEDDNNFDNDDDDDDDDYCYQITRCPDSWHIEEYCECGELPPEAKHDDDCPCCNVYQQNTTD